MWTRQDERATEDEEHRKGLHLPPRGWCGLCMAALARQQARMTRRR